MILLKRSIRPKRLKIRPLLRQTSPFRAAFFTVTNLIGFVLINAFFNYINTGRWFDFSLASYRTALACPLSEVFVQPLGIFSHPWMIPVTGLVLTAIISVPILVAVLYRLWIFALFVLTVAVVGHAPLLAVFMAAGCLLAGMTQLRNEVPFLAMLAGFAPIGLYWFFFSGTDEQVLDPLQKLVLHLTFIILMIIATIAGAVVLNLARLARFRPGVIWPVLLILLAAPIWLFYQKVGSAELDYALIVRDIGPAEELIAPVKMTNHESPALKPSRQAYSETLPTSNASTAKRDFNVLLTRAKEQLDTNRRKLIKKCRKFMRLYPNHSRTPALLWIIATAMDIQIDVDALISGKVRYYYVGPSEESLVIWEALAERFPRSPQALIAHQRLGIGAIRHGRIQKALEHLRTAQSLMIIFLDQSRAGGTFSKTGVFTTRRSVPSKEYYRKILFQTDTIIWLMEMNDIVDGKSKDIEAFSEYMKLWPFAGVSRKELQDLAEAFRKTQLEDNFRFRAAIAIKKDLDRAVELSQLATKVNDAAILANYELGCLAVRLGSTPGWSAKHLKPAEYYFKIVKNAQENPYITAAEKQLKWLALGKKAKTSQ